MREFTFGIEYDRDDDPIMSVFDAAPSLVGHSLDAVAGQRRFWRIERLAGPDTALDRIERIRFDDDCCCEAITERRCDTLRYHDVLDRSANELVCYTYLDDIRSCESVHTLAGKHLQPGLVFETRRRGSTHWWRVLMRSDDGLGVFYDDLTARLRESLSFRMGHVRDVTEWRRDSLATVALPEEQAEALRAATEAGYYDPPREVTLDEIATDLSIPRSTLSYRLRQAESQLVHRYVDRGDGVRWLD